MQFRGGVIDGTEVSCSQGASEVLFDGVAFKNMPDRILQAISGSTVWLFGDTSRNGSTAGLSPWVDKDGSSTVTYSAPGGTSLGTTVSDASLWFGQSPALTVDGNAHVGHSNAGTRVNVRDFIATVDLATRTFYFTMLVRVEGGLSTVDLTAEFFDGAGATGNRRATAGITNGDFLSILRIPRLPLEPPPAYMS